MDLWEFYDHVRSAIANLRALGYTDQADRVETALGGGATSGEVLGDLSLALPVDASSVPSLAAELNALAQWAATAWSGR